MDGVSGISNVQCKPIYGQAAGRHISMHSSSVKDTPHMKLREFVDPTRQKAAFINFIESLKKIPEIPAWVLSGVPVKVITRRDITDTGEVSGKILGQNLREAANEWFNEHGHRSSLALAMFPHEWSQDDFGRLLVALDWTLMMGQKQAVGLGRSSWPSVEQSVKDNIPMMFYLTAVRTPHTPHEIEDMTEQTLAWDKDGNDIYYPGPDYAYIP